MCPGAGLHADKTGLQAFEKRQDLTATELPLHDRRAGRVDAVQLK